MTEVEQLREALRQKQAVIEDLERRLEVCPELKRLRLEVQSRTNECDYWCDALDRAQAKIKELEDS